MEPTINIPHKVSPRAILLVHLEGYKDAEVKLYTPYIAKPKNAPFINTSWSVRFFCDKTNN